MNKHRMKTACALLASAMFAAAAQGAEEFEDAVPLELAEIFLGVGEEGGLYRDLPADFPLASAPAGFAVLGTVEHPTSRSVYLSSTQAGDAAQDALAEAFVAAGWQRIPSPFSGERAQQGFVDPRGNTFPNQLCHDDGGRLTVAPRPGEGTVLMVQQFRLPPAALATQPTCADMVAQRRDTTIVRDSFGGGLRAHLPRLVLPREADFGGRPAGSTGGSSGGNRDVETRTELSIDWEPARVYEHLANQLSEQGWTLEDDWNTARVAGGSWTRSAEGMTLVGVLSVEHMEDTQHYLRFRMMQLLQ